MGDFGLIPLLLFLSPDSAVASLAAPAVLGDFGLIPLLLLLSPVSALVSLAAGADGGGVASFTEGTEGGELASVRLKGNAGSHREKLRSCVRQICECNRQPRT